MTQPVGAGHQRALILLALALAVSGCGKPPPSGPPAVAGLAIEPGLRRARYRFQTSFPARVSVEVQPADDLTHVEDSSGETSQHGGVLTNLAPGRRYTLQLTQGPVVLAEQAFLTRVLTVEDVHQDIQGDRLRLLWNTSAAAHCLVTWRASGAESQSIEETGPPGTAHAVEIAHLERDHSYDVTITLRLPDGEEETSGPFRIGHARGLAEDFLLAWRSANLPTWMQDLLTHLKDQDPQRPAREGKLLQAASALRRPLGVLKPYLPDVLSSVSAAPDLQVRVYDALAGIAHLERLANVMGLPLIPLLTGLEPGKPLDCGPFYQEPTARLCDAKGVHPTILHQEFPGEGVNLREWHPGTDDSSLYLLHRNPPKREATVPFDLPDPLHVLKAEVGLATRRFYPLQYLEVTVNNRIDLVLRPPPTDPPFYQWNVDWLGLDPALLKPGRNTLRLRLRPLPGSELLKTGFVKWVELHLQPAP